MCLPKRGGDLWVELGSGDVVRGSIVEHTDARGRRRHGVVTDLKRMKFSSLILRAIIS